MKNILTIMSLALLLPQHTAAKSKDHLTQCWEKQVKPIGSGYLNFSYQENTHDIAHLSEPWESYHSTGKGAIWCNCVKFLKNDTVARWGSDSYSKTQLSLPDSTLLYLGYGNKELSKITQSAFLDEPVGEAGYSPVLIVNYFHEHDAAVKKENTKHDAIYTLTINNTTVQLFIRKKDDILEHVTTLNNIDLYGDVTTTINYSDFSEANTLCYPKTVTIGKINGKLHDTITLSPALITKTAEPLLEKPANYSFAEEKVTLPEISVEKYNDHIHFITLKHTNGRAMVLEFNDFLLVAEAPLNSANGEIIINEAKKIAPGKPIKYFIFDHYHPDYIGGMRAFIHKGATVLCTAGDKDYVQYLADASHTLKPDSLEIEPRPLHIEDIGDHKTISDGAYRMEVYLIGMKSAHTKDYLVYYFPQEKMLFEGDLVWVSTKGPVRKAGKRQAGLYNAIKSLNLDVATIEQSWPVGENYGAKAEIPFADMVEAMGVK